MECVDRTFYVEIVGIGNRDELLYLSNVLTHQRYFPYSLCYAFQLGNYLIFNGCKHDAKFNDKGYVVAMILDIQETSMRIKAITDLLLVYDADDEYSMDSDDAYNLLSDILDGNYDDENYGEYTIKVDFSDDHVCELCK